MRFRYIVVPLSRDRKVFPFRNNIYDVSPPRYDCSVYVLDVGISIIDIIVNIVATCLKVPKIGPRWRKLDVSSVSSEEFNIFNPVEVVIDLFYKYL